jgi:hypothetical protein
MAHLSCGKKINEKFKCFSAWGNKSAPPPPVVLPPPPQEVED